MKCKRNSWCFILVLSLTFFLIGSQELEGIEEDVLVNYEGTDETYVIVGGIPVGIYLDTNGVMVIGTQEIVSADGMTEDPSGTLIFAGDYIVGMNGISVNTKSDLLYLIEELGEEEVVLEIRRNEELLEVSVTPILDENETYKLGIWVRDNLQGLGTLTYIDTQSSFATLGHGINDVDTGALLEIDQGELYTASINRIIKGEVGSPGGLEGVIIYNSSNILGEITANTSVGVFGTIFDIENLDMETELLPVASIDEIEEGTATIRCTVDDEVKEYEIEILEVNKSDWEVNKGLVIQITDEELIALTGGIVQGMSGAPILQNGKLIGAVTHVFVNNPTQGYGIFIENMLETAESVE